MCYCCRKLEIWSFYVFGRPNLGGRAPLIGSDRSDQISEPIREHSLPHGLPNSASHGLPQPRPPTFCHVICLSQSEESTASHGRSASHAHQAMQSDPRAKQPDRPEDRTLTAGQPWEADRPLTHTGRCCDPRGRLTDFTAKCIASPGVRERPIGLPHGLSLRTLRQIT